MRSCIGNQTGREFGQETASDRTTAGRLIQDPKWTWIALFAIMAGALASYVLNFGSFQVGVYMDDAEYVVLARSLAQGLGLALTNFPHGALDTRYPPGYPLILSPIAFLLPNQIAPLQAVSVACTLLSLPLAYALLRSKGCQRGLSLMVVLLFAFNPVVVAHSSMVMSEACQFLTILLALSLFRLFVQGRDWLCIPSGFLAAFAFLVRVSSVALLLAMGLHLVLKRDYRKLFLWAMCVAAVLTPYFVHNTHVWGTPLNPVYLRQVSWSDLDVNQLTPGREDVASRLTRAMIYYVFDAIPSVLLPGTRGPKTIRVLEALHVAWAGGLGYVGLLCVMALGWWQFVRRKQFDVAEIFLVIYALLLLAWPWHLARLLYPVGLFLYLYLYVGGTTMVQWLGGWLSDRWQRGSGHAWAGRALVVATAIVVLSLHGYQLLQGIADQSPSHVPDLEAGASWIAAHTPESAVVMTSHPISRHLYTERLTVGIPCDNETAQQLLLAADTRVDYVLIAPQLVWSESLIEDECSVDVVEPILLAHPERFGLVYEDQEDLVRVYHVKPQVIPSQSSSVDQ